ncbi:histidine phosphatase family protein [Chitinophaga barathri]|uniref:Histidine phosphatase family protein n=1 Tax=Chitinophaga barathri TaxID=1647451 RepID=A0A3N4MK93_9BACT|nr:histidine phosphatase family protein [Chitinophaga barathri]RPD42337.1 histidine phosphatase family protein [Chitinophaga barathri]
MMRKMIAGMMLVGVMAACGQSKKPERATTPVAEDSTFLTGTFFLVRHAEKNPGRDSTLTTEGRQRAGKLYRILKDSAISRIYTTPFKRTVETGDSLRILGKVDTAFYQPDSTGESLLYEISRRGDWGKRILVVGHSNTLIPLIKSLNAKPKMDSISEKDYGNLFIIHKGVQKAELVEKRY